MVRTPSTANSFLSAAVLLGALVGSGCFQSPDTSRLQCLDTEHCPHGYSCVVSQSGAYGLCTKGTAGLDAVAADLPRPGDGSPTVEVLRASDTAVDQRVGADLALLDVRPPETTVEAGPEAMMDAPVVPRDVAADGAPDLPRPDGPSDAPDLSARDALADAGEQHPDGAADAGPDSSRDSSGKARGAPCTTHVECAGGFCADGYCCDSACTGTCQACDIVPGKCTTLSANATPRPGHGACAAGDATCAGRCDGTSSACFYPSVTCGAASCTGTTYTPAGTCTAGACVATASQSCPANQTCSGNACACLAPKLSCSSSCIDPTSDPQHCGACGHDCKGGGCVQGRCQPVVIVGNLPDSVDVFGVDAQYVYYWYARMLLDTTQIYRIAKTAVSGTGSLLSDYGVTPQGVIGSTLFFGRDRFGFQVSCNLTSCSSTIADLPSSGATLVDFRSPAPEYFTRVTTDPTLTLTWYVPTSNTVVTTYSDSNAPIYYSDEGFFAYGKMVYWIRNVLTETGSLTDRVLYGLDSTTMARSQLAGDLSAELRIFDANAISVLLWNSGNGDLHRVALPFGAGSSAPPLLLAASSATTVVEAATGVYWVDSGGTLYRCSASDCAGTKTILTNGQNTDGLYQDDAFLYWGTSSPNQVVRLVK